MGGQAGLSFIQHRNAEVVRRNAPILAIGLCLLTTPLLGQLIEPAQMPTVPFMEEATSPPFSIAPSVSASLAKDQSTSPSFFRNARFDDLPRGIGTNFTDFPEFGDGLTIYGNSAALKIGGYVKADLITDFDAIDSTDTFDTGTILPGTAKRRNARFHARQTRLSFDTRWRVNQEVARAFIEVDFFGDRTGANNSLRLRHAYGRLGNLTVGQTWTTFTDPSAVPQTLDFEGAVSNVNRRQGLVRLQKQLPLDGFSLAVAVEDPRIDLEIPSGIQGAARTETPDFISHLRYEQDWCEFQIAMVLRELGFQPVGQRVQTDTAWGFNFTGSMKARDATKAYYQITFGEGIGSYRGSPDVVATSATTAEILPVFGWMVGLKQSWSDRVSSNLTYSELYVDAIPGQSPDNLLDTSYFAVNLIQNPYESVFWGVEYLHGTRRNQSFASASASRVQLSFGFFLP